MTCPQLRRLAACLLAGLVLAAGVAPTHADSNLLRVSATVQKHVKLQVLSQPPGLTITRQDLQRGYVEVDTPVQVAVRTNTEDYAIVFDPMGDVVRQVRVRGLEADYEFDGAGAMVPQRLRAGRAVQLTHELRFRFLLAAGATPGTYPWPLHVSAQAL